jgi:membrane associated rhomboid family serine protease
MGRGRGIGEGTADDARATILTEIKLQATIVGGLVGTMWAEEVVDAVAFQGGLDRFGIHPRTKAGLLGIPLAPFLHADFGHLVANTVPLVVLGFFIMARRKRDLAVVTALATLVGGLGVWLVGASNSVHLGASILVFGYLGYLLSRGYFERRFWPIVGSLVVFFLYGGALFGLLPGRPGISWEGHLFGFVGGVLAARMLAPRRT